MPGPQTKIESVSIKGFRSLADIEMSRLPDVTVMIGANGSGKSNVVRFFEMLRWMLKLRRLAEFVARQGGADDQLFGGSKRTSSVEATVGLRTGTGECKYGFTLNYAQPDRLTIANESIAWENQGEQPKEWQSFSNLQRESGILEDLQDNGEIRFSDRHILTMMRLLTDHQAYQFHDTSDTSNMKISWDLEDNHRLHGNGGNLAAVLYLLEQEDVRRFDLICRHIGRVLPKFDRFVIEDSYGKVLLRWKAKWSDKTFRRSSNVGRVAAVLRAGHTAQSPSGDASERDSAGRAGAGLASGCDWPCCRDDRAVVARQADYRGDAIAVAGG